MNKRRRKKEMVKQIKKLVEQNIDFVYFKSYNYTMLPKSYILALTHPNLYINMSSDAVPEINISAEITDQQVRKIMASSLMEGWRY